MSQVSSGAPRRQQVVVVGAGFGGLEAVRRLRDCPVDITVIDRRNYHLFQPLLYQVAAAALSPADIAWPIRNLLSGQDNARVILGRVTGVDRKGKMVQVGQANVPYDVLVLATGARHSYFGNDHWEQFAPGLKKIEDATDIRRRVLVAFERAEVATNPAEQAALLTFVVIGGGPTGVEMAGAIAELASHALAADFHHINTKLARVILVEAGPRLLATFPEKLSAAARTDLEKLSVTVRTEARVTDCTAEGVAMGPEFIPCKTIVWAAGVIASPAGKWLEAPTNRVGRVIVNDKLTLPDDDSIFVVGDTAAAANTDGKPIPGIAPAAKQMGKYVADTIRQRVAGKPALPRFHYVHQGNLATIGRSSAVVHMGSMQIKGFMAWMLWSLAHIYFLIGFKHRIVVALNWVWSYLTFERGARLIVGEANVGLPQSPEPKAH